MTRAIKMILTLYGLFLFLLFFSAMAWVTVNGPGNALVVWFTLLIVSTLAVSIAASMASPER